MYTHARLAVAILLALAAVPSNLLAQTGIAPARAPLLIVRDAERPVEVSSLAVATEVEGGLARTTIQLSIRNPNARRLEGQLQFPLEPGQQVSGFALDVDGQMRAAVPVPKQKGQEVFEAVERRGIDPGLLEQTAGNQFKLRVYPIPPNGERRVRIVIDQPLRRAGDGWLLHLPLAFARGIERVPLRVLARGQAQAPRIVDGFVRTPLNRDGDGWSLALDGRAAGLGKGLTLRFAATAQPQAFVQEFAGQRYFHVDVPLADASAPRPLPHTIGLLWDSSGSARKRDIDSELALLDRYFAAVRTAQVRLTRLRDVPEATRTFEIRNGDWSALRRELRATVYDGASALEDWKPQADVQEYLLVSDGLANYGLAAQMPSLAAGQRLYALDSAGADADAVRLSAWADARGGRLIAWQGMAGVAQAANQLTLEGPRLLRMEGVGANDLVADSAYPQQGQLRIAGRLTQAAASVTLIVGQAGRERRIVVPISGDTPASTLVAGLWASYRMHALSAEPVGNAQALRDLGERFGLVGPGTSLLVLENAADYVRYDIAPPAELRAEVADLKNKAAQQSAADAKAHMARVRAEFAQKIAWYEKPWPKGTPSSQVAPGKPAAAREGARVAMAMPAPAPPAQAAAPLPSADRASALESVAVTGARVARKAADTGGGQGANIGIALQPWQPASPFARTLRAAPAAQMYALYLGERAAHVDSAAFYLDVAGILFERGQRELALRVLSNLAEMDVENRQLLRALGYRLLEARAYGLAIGVFAHVRRIADNEPQSWRDLALAQVADGREQEAVDNLWRVVSGSWDSRFPSIELIALGELDAIVANARKPLDVRAIPADLRRNLPLDLRVVLSWDTDNTDLDLWVTDPNGEKTFYGSPHSYQGGWLSHDCTQGYGPEEFILRNAKPGKYKVEVNFFGDRQQLITGPTTFKVNLFTGFGTRQQKTQAVTLRLTDVKATTFVGNFDVK